MSVELLLTIGLAVGVPLLGAITTCLIFIVHVLRTFNEILKKVESSLGHNRDEHTKMLAAINAVVNRIELLEERVIKRE